MSRRSTPNATSPAEVDRWLEADTAGAEVRYGGTTGGARQHPVEDDEVGGALGELELGFVTPFHALDDITLRLEVVGEQQSEISLILDHEDTQRRGAVWAGDCDANVRRRRAQRQRKHEASRKREILAAPLTSR